MKRLISIILTISLLAGIYAVSASARAHYGIDIDENGQIVHKIFSDLSARLEGQADNHEESVMIVFKTVMLDRTMDDDAFQKLMNERAGRDVSGDIGLYRRTRLQLLTEDLDRQIRAILAASGLTPDNASEYDPWHAHCIMTLSKAEILKLNENDGVLYMDIDPATAPESKLTEALQWEIEYELMTGRSPWLPVGIHTTYWNITGTEYLQHKEEVDETIRQDREAVISKLGLTEDTIIAAGVNCTVAAKLTLEQIRVATALDEVKQLDLWAAEPVESPTDTPTEQPGPLDFPSTQEEFRQFAFENQYQYQVTKGESHSFPYTYREQYLHYANEGDFYPDWVLVQAKTNVELPDPIELKIGNRVLYAASRDGAFAFTLGVCDTGGSDRNVFYDLTEVDPENYPGLVSYLKAAGIGKPVGDADTDGEITIFDVSVIQRHIAKLGPLYTEHPDRISTEDQYRKDLADADSDGEVTIFDATQIQRHIAKMSS